MDEELLTEYDDSGYDELASQILARKAKKQQLADSARTGPASVIADILLGTGGAIIGAYKGDDTVGQRAIAAKNAAIENRLKALDDSDAMKSVVDLAKAKQAEKLRLLGYNVSMHNARTIAEGQERRHKETISATLGKQKDQQKFINDQNEKSRKAQQEAKETEEKNRRKDKAEERRHQKEMKELEVGYKKAEKDLLSASTLRKEYLGLPTTKDTQDIAAAFERVKQAASQPSAAGDLAMIFNYMKMLDPGSTVREGEFANAQNAGGIPERIVNVYNRALKGERLAPAQRDDFLNQSRKQLAAQLASQKKWDDQYKGLAQKYGVDPSFVVLEYPSLDVSSTPSIKTIKGVTYQKQADGKWYPVK